MNLNKEEKKLVGYFLAGHPSEEECIDILMTSQKQGIDIFEIGFPSENPYFDGDIIKQAHEEVRDKKIHFKIEFWETLRNKIDHPIWVMAYKKDLVDTGFYLKLASKRLIDGLVLADCTPDERFTIAKQVKQYNVDVLGFINTQMNQKELEETLNHFPLIYFQLYVGVTGSVIKGDEEYLPLLKEIKEKYNNYLFAGFGVSTPDRVKTLSSQDFDGVIVGTVLINKLQNNKKEMYTLIKEMKEKLIERDD